MKKLIVGFILFGIFLVLEGCASENLRMLPEDTLKMDSHEGIVIGSIVVKVEDLLKGESVGSCKPLGNLKWWITVSPNKNLDSIIFSSSKYGISAISDGQEVEFVSKLPAGRYYFHNVTQDGWVAGEAPKFPMKVAFDVLEGEITYVGRLILTLPHYIPNSKYLMHFFSKLSVKIEDAQEETVNSLAMVFKLTDKKVSKDIMAQRTGRSSSGLFLANITPEKLLTIKNIIKTSGYANASAENYPYEGAFVTQYLKNVKSSGRHLYDQVRILLSFKASDLSDSSYHNFYLDVLAMNPPIRKVF
jgi:hypothetical protein